MTGPDGTEWTVRSRAEPSGGGDQAGEEEPGFWDSPRGWLVTLAAVAAFVALAWWTPLGAAVFAATLLAAEGVSLLRARNRPWLVEAHAEGGARSLTWRVEGRRRASRAVNELGESLARGEAEDPPGAVRL